MKKAIVKNIAWLSYAIMAALCVTSCTSFEREEMAELINEAYLSGMPEKSLVEVSSFDAKNSQELAISPVAEYNFRNEEDGNSVSFRGRHCKINSIVVDYDEVVGNSRQVNVTAYGTADDMAEAEDGSKQLVATCSYTQQVLSTPEEEKVYTYDYLTKEELVETENSCINQIYYEVHRYLNGSLDKTWKFFADEYSYYWYGGSSKEYTANYPDWKTQLLLPEGENAVNMIGTPINVDYGTTVSSKSITAYVVENGEKTTDLTAVTLTEEVKGYVGDFTYITTANARVNAEGTFTLKTTKNLVFVDVLTGHREEFQGSEGELILAKTEYVNNPDATPSLTGSDGTVYEYLGDYTFYVDAKVNGKVVCTSKTKFPTYAAVL